METALLFSGGIDSTYTALLVGKETDVHLLTYRNGYGQFFFNRARKRYHELKRHGQFTHHPLSIKSLFRTLYLKDCTDYPAFAWCLSCKLAMHIRTINHCRMYNIKQVYDGSAADTAEMVEQSTTAHNLIKELYAAHSITFSSPAYKISREQKKDFLQKKGFRLGIQIFNRNMGIQPKCIPGELYYAPYILCNIRPSHDPEKIEAFFKEKETQIQRLIR
ncbi:MAG: hypothetical protein ACQESG_00065 [Nanobdellota archaeon]